MRIITLFFKSTHLLVYVMSLNLSLLTTVIRTQEVKILPVIGGADAGKFKQHVAQIVVDERTVYSLSYTINHIGVLLHINIGAPYHKRNLILVSECHRVYLAMVTAALFPVIIDLLTVVGEIYHDGIAIPERIKDHIHHIIVIQSRIVITGNILLHLMCQIRVVPSYARG